MLGGTVLMTDLTKKRRLLARNGRYVLLKAKSVNQTARKMQPRKNYRLKWSSGNQVFWSLWKPRIPPPPPPNRIFNADESDITSGPNKLPKVTAGVGVWTLVDKNVSQIAGCWSIQCVVSALHVLHVARAMIFPCKKKCHEFGFEANCERTVVSRNLVEKTVVLMSNSNMWIRISRSTRGRVDTVSQM
jgi:hypothetical protein